MPELLHFQADFAAALRERQSTPAMQRWLGGDDDLVEERRRTVDDIEVAVGNRVETAGIDDASHAAQTAGLPGIYEAESASRPAKPKA